MENKWLELLKSRKFWAMIVGFVFLFLGDNIGFDQEAITSAVYLIVSFIVSLAYVDAQRAKAQG